MTTGQLVEEIDAEIDRLMKAKSILTDTNVAVRMKPGPKPKGSAIVVKKKKYTMTPAAREKLSAAMKRRWAKSTKAA